MSIRPHQASNVIDLLPDPQQAREAEISVLGAAMIGADIDELLDILQPSDFYSPAHEATWTAITSLHLHGIRPDMVTVYEELRTQHPKTKIAAADLHHMTAIVPITANAAYYAEQVVTAAGLRQLQTGAVKVAQLARTPGNLDERREQARQTIDAACRGRTTTQARMLAAILEDVLDVAEHGTAEALPTPWPDLDRLIGGLAPGRLIVLGARPGVGKSVALVNLALQVAAIHGHAVHFASMEMPSLEIGQRFLACYASADLGRLMSGTTDDTEWARISQKQAALTSMPLYIDDTSDQTIHHIRAKVRDTQRQREDLALICVDYLQLMRIAERRGNRAEEVAEISRGLKLLARESGACVVAAAQLNREAAKRDKPQLTDLRESGAIEADADQVILMHQPNEELPEIDLLVDKNRHGPKGVTRLQIAGHYAQLRSTWNTGDRNHHP